MKIAKLGTSNFLNHTIMMAVAIVLNNSLAYYGALAVYGKDIPLAVSGVATKLNSIMVAFVVGLATTNTRESIAPLCDMVIDDFTGFTLDSIR